MYRFELNKNEPLDNKLNALFLSLWSRGVILYDIEYHLKLEYSIKQHIKDKTWKKIHYSPS